MFRSSTRFVLIVISALSIRMVAATPPMPGDSSVQNPGSTSRGAIAIPQLFVRPNPLPNSFLRRPGFLIGGQFVDSAIDRWIAGFSDYRPMQQLANEGMQLARSC